MGLVHPCMSYEFVPVCFSSSCVHHWIIVLLFESHSFFRTARIISFVLLSVLAVPSHTVFSAVSTLPWLRQLVAGVSPQRPGFSMWNLCLEKWKWDTFYSEYFSFPLLVLFHEFSMYTFHYPLPVLYVLMTDSFMATLSSLVPHML